MNLAFNAMMFAREVHRDQRRKYTGNPYVDHLAEVVGLAVTALGDSGGVVAAVSWLHDCIEDQKVKHSTLVDRFGDAVADGVLTLSDLETGTRANRKAASRARFAAAPAWLQTIKCADIISNTGSIGAHDPEFAADYLAEKRLMLDELKIAEPRLLALARSLVTR